MNLAGSGQALDSSLATIYSAFMLRRDETGVFRNSATMWKLKPHEGRSKNLIQYGRLIAYDLADGVDMDQSQSLADTVTTHTPGEVGVQVMLPGSTMRRVADPDLLKQAGRMCANAYDLKEDQDGGLQMVNFTPTMGVANSVIGLGEYYGAITRLMLGNNRANPEPAPEPYMIVDHPIKIAVLAGRLVPFTDVPAGTNIYLPATVAQGRTIGPGTNGFTEKILKDHIGAIGHLFGATVKKSANLIPDTSDDVSGGVFSKEGLHYVSELEPRSDPDTSNKSLRGAVELNHWGSYVFGVFNPASYGVEIIGDATMPAAS